VFKPLCNVLLDLAINLSAYFINNLLNISILIPTRPTAGGWINPEEFALAKTKALYLRVSSLLNNNY